jgi:hypothetical protein
MHRSIAVILSLLMSLHVFGQTSSSNLSKDQIKADVKYLLTAIDEIPVNPYVRINKSKFLKEMDKAEEKLFAKEKVTIIDLYSCLQPVIVLLEDGHTELYINSYIDETNYLVFPFELSISSGGLIVKGINAGYKELISSDNIGKKLNNINGHSSKEILSIINRYSSGETKNSRLALSGYLFNTIFNVFLSKEKTLKISFTDKGSLQVNLLRKSEVKDNNQVSPGIPNYSYKLDEATQTAVLTFNNFTALNKFKTFLSEMFSSLKNKNIKNLIIDIRNNGGGNSDLGDELLKYICPVPFTQYEKTVMKFSTISKAYVKANASAESEEVKKYLAQKDGTLDTIDKSKDLISPEKEDKRFTGNIYLFTSRATFSSAADFANAFKFYKLGKIVGEETGGFVISPGEDITTRLPNSQLEIHISSSKDFDVGVSNGAWSGVRPDVEVKQEDALRYTINKLIL